MKKSILFGLMLVLMLTHPVWVTEGARCGLLLWYRAVVPALFPFLVLSTLIVAEGGIDLLVRPLWGLLHPLFSLSIEGCYVLASGLLCGCPVGAKTCADFFKEGRIPMWEARVLLAICNHPSPMFLAGYVCPLLPKEIGIRKVLISVYLPVLILMIAAKRIYFRKETGLEGKTYTEISSVSLDASILSAAELLCKIGGYLIIFSIMIVFLENTTYLPFSLRIFLIGATEITTGIHQITRSCTGISAACGSVAAFCFGGLSGLFQTRSVIAPANGKAMSWIEKNAGLSIRQYFFWKLIHAALAAGLMYLFIAAENGL